MGKENDYVFMVSAEQLNDYAVANASRRARH